MRNFFVFIVVVATCMQAQNVLNADFYEKASVAIAPNLQAQENSILSLAGATYCAANSYLLTATSHARDGVPSKYGAPYYLLFTSPTKGKLVHSYGLFIGQEGDYIEMLNFDYRISENSITLTTRISTTDGEKVGFKEFKSGTYRGDLLKNSIYINMGGHNMLFISIDN